MLKTKLQPLLTCMVSFTMFQTTVLADDWLQWRGPNFNGVSDAKDLPDEWSVDRKENIAWVSEGLGGSATPIVVDQMIYLPLTTADDDLYAICLARENGRIVWKKKMGKGRRANRNVGMACPSPVSDGNQVYFLFGQGTLAAMSLDGKLKWKRELEKEYNVFSQKYGYCSSPVLYDGILYLTMLRRLEIRFGRDNGKPMDSFILAVDPRTGKTLWKKNRLTEAPEESRDAYNTAVISREGIIVVGGDLVTCNDLKTGEEKWRYDYQAEMLRNGEIKARFTNWRIISSPVMAGELVITPYPRGERLMAIKSGKKVWDYQGNIPDVSSPAFKDGLIYILDGRKPRKSYLLCFEAKTGKLLWEDAFESETGFYTSPLIADGKIYAINFTNEVFVWAEGRKKRRLKHFTMINEKYPRKVVCSASPIAVDHSIFIRTPTKLFCVEK